MLQQAAFTFLRSLRRCYCFGHFSFLFNAPIDLSPQQERILEAARDLASKEMKPYMVQWDKKEVFPVDAMRKAAQLGFAAIYASEKYGGSGLTRLDASLVFEGLSQGCVSTAAYISIHNIALWMIDTFGNEEQRKKWIPPLARMDIFASYCLIELGSGSDAATLSTTARRDGDHYVLNGTKDFVCYGGESDIYVMMVRTGEKGPRGISCVVVEKGTTGLSFGEKKRINTQTTRDAILNDCRIPVSNRIGSEGEGFGIAMKGLNDYRISIASCSIGIAQAALEIIAKFNDEWVVYDKLLTDFTFHQYWFAEFTSLMFASRLMVRKAAALHQNNAEGAAVVCKSAAYFAHTKSYEVMSRLQCIEKLYSADTRIRKMGLYHLTNRAISFPLSHYYVYNMFL